MITENNHEYTEQWMENIWTLSWPVSLSSAIPRSKFQLPPPPAARCPPPASRRALQPRPAPLLPAEFGGRLRSKLRWNITIETPNKLRLRYVTRAVKGAPTWTLERTLAVPFPWCSHGPPATQRLAMLGSVGSQRPGLFSALPAGREAEEAAWVKSLLSEHKPEKKGK